MKYIKRRWTNLLSLTPAYQDLVLGNCFSNESNISLLYYFAFYNTLLYKKGVVNNMSEILVTRRSSRKSGSVQLVTELITVNTNWVAPSASLNAFSVRIFGGGGGGDKSGGGGGGWMNNQSNIILSPGEVIQIAIGDGGNGRNDFGNASTGGTTSFGTYLSANGGAGYRWKDGSSGGGTLNTQNHYAPGTGHQFGGGGIFCWKSSSYYHGASSGLWGGGGGAHPYELYRESFSDWYFYTSMGGAGGMYGGGGGGMHGGFGNVYGGSGGSGNGYTLITNWPYNNSFGGAGGNSTVLAEDGINTSTWTNVAKDEKTGNMLVGNGRGGGIAGGGGGFGGAGGNGVQSTKNNNHWYGGGGGGYGGMGGRYSGGGGGYGGAGGWWGGGGGGYGKGADGGWYGGGGGGYYSKGGNNGGGGGAYGNGADGSRDDRKGSDAAAGSGAGGGGGVTVYSGGGNGGSGICIIQYYA